MANATVQLESLEKRLSKGQREKRNLKIEARRTVAQALAREIGLTRLATGQSLAQLRRWLLYTTIIAASAFVLGALALCVAWVR